MKIHIVQKGDTLWKLAKQYNVNFEDLKAVNTQLTNPDLIMPGMKIKIPTGGVPIKKEVPKQMYKEKEKPMLPKEQPIVVPPPIKEMPQQMPPMIQPMPPMPPPMPQQQMQAIDMNFNFYKPSMPPPPKVMPQVKPEAPKKEKPIYKEKPTTTKPKEQPVLEEYLPQPPPAPQMPQELPMMPMPMPMPMPQPYIPCYPEPYYPISPVMPGCANPIMPYYSQPMYLPQASMPTMMSPCYPANYTQSMPMMAQDYSPYYGTEQLGYEHQFPQPMRMYQTPDQFEENDDFDED